jgi:hypothetical protein
MLGVVRVPVRPQSSDIQGHGFLYSDMTPSAPTNEPPQALRQPQRKTMMAAPVREVPVVVSQKYGVADCSR